MGGESTQAKLPQDYDSQPIQTLRVDETAIASVGITGVNVATLLPVSTLPAPSPLEIYEVTVTLSARFATGGVSVDATNARALNPGTYTYRLPAGHTYFAVLAIGSVSGSPVCTVARLY